MDCEQNDNIILLEEKYEIDRNKQIGRGSYGVVYECRDRTKPNSDQKLCAKITQILQHDKKQSREFEVMSKIKTVAIGNPNIIQVIDVLVHEEKIVIIQERCQCDLECLIKQKRKDKKRFTPKEALEIIKQLSYGYKVLIAENIIHRDLKPGNILFLNDTYKIADFGFAREAHPYGDHTKLGTPGYYSPQVVWSSSYTNQADIFSLGVIFYKLIFDNIPFQVGDDKIIKNSLFNLKNNPIRVSRDLPEFQADDSIPELIERMLLYYEEDRISWSQFFQHKLIVQSYASQPTNFPQRMLTPDTDIEQEPVKEKTSSIKHNIQVFDNAKFLPQISKSIQEACEQNVFQAPNLFQSQQQQYTIMLCQHYEIGILIAYVEYEVYQNKNYLISITHYQYLFLRRILCNLAFIFLNSAKNGQLPFINFKQECEKFFTAQQVVVIFNFKTLKKEFQANKLPYNDEKLDIQNQDKFIEDLKQFMKQPGLKYNSKNIYYFRYQRLLGQYIHYISQQKQATKPYIRLFWKLSKSMTIQVQQLII
ncbi:unnamed protein product (macronuclear) [Paramecium tetraurelia]|uniref:Chromosome undetermined scaffold_226, whole genome shotgun sequence n=1 Tax=Paramecium tetraurelia TaxID=5888 RepID=A0CNZ6_PARTE|nr:uncharacterized protein GSPATT00038782001 [Paramecium tetraurelia]XP_001458512.1 uncharacterized protein GSPATT00023843001 [Paramecium tetraurelia]CAK72513.1 unnamed protein product [Paramecium tetraurelia]CAK91115.1 unnamed protein product [Paramecium tetraurelia]|eukprot:XP_001439910.1 hypothetical protein (macronuclear) [Paramecium tetraurelia strain d4-2]